MKGVFKIDYSHGPGIMKLVFLCAWHILDLFMSTARSTLTRRVFDFWFVGANWQDPYGLGELVAGKPLDPKLVKLVWGRT
jgi:hypothetical protein